MQTHYSSRLVGNPSSNPTPNPNPKGRNRRPPTEGYEDAIVVPAITADNFELKHGLLTLVQNKQFFGHDKEDPHAHIRYFNKITSTLNEAWDRFKDLLRACPHHGFSKLHQLDTFYNALNSKDQDSLNSAAGGNFLDKIPRECLAIIESESKVRYSRNKPVVSKVSMNTSTFGISPDVVELKDMVKTLLLDKKSRNQAPATVKAVEESFNYNQGNTSYHPPMMSNQIRPPGFPLVPNNQNVQLNQRNNQNRFNQNQNRGNNFNHGPVYQPSIFQPPAYQAPTYQALAPQTQDCKIRSSVTKLTTNVGNFLQIFKDLNFNISFVDALILMPKFGPSIKILLTNRDKLCELARTPLNKHYSVVLQKKLPEKLGDPGKFLIPCDFLGKAKCLALEDLGASINLMPLSVWNNLSLPDLSPTCVTLDLANHLISRLVGVAEDVYAKVGTFHFPADFVVVDFDADPRVPLILERSFLKIERALIDVFKGELTLRVGKEAITFNLDQTSRYSANYGDMTAKQIDVIDMACEEYSQEVLGFSDMIASGNTTPYYDPIVSNTSPALTPFKNSDFLLEEVYAFLAIEDNPTSPEVDQSYLDSEGDILLLEAFLNDDPSLPLQIKEIICLKFVELKDLPPHLEYAFLEGDDKLTVIIAKYLSMEEKTSLITVLKSHKRAIAWKFSDIKEGIVLDHKISKEGIEVDKAKVDVITKLPHPTTVKGIRSFIGRVGFYRRFIKDFSKIAKPMTHLLEKDTPFLVSKECVEAFKTLKRKLTKAPIMIAPDWDMPFELLCDASDYVIGAVLGNKSIVYTDHSALKYLFAKKDSKARLLHWVLLLQEFTFKVIDTKGAKNQVADHLSRLENPHQNLLDPKEINESFPLETLNLVSTRGNSSTLWFAEFVNYHVGNFVVKGMSSQQKSVYMARKPFTFSRLAIMDLSGDTMAQITQPRRKVQLNELRDQAYENSLIYKEKTKRLHDSKIKTMFSTSVIESSSLTPD
nr:reverse transcriptase domain-containing protein [Tanacetum cinerariifolium]